MNQEVVRSCTSRTRVGCYSKLHMIFMGKALEIIQLVIDHDTIFVWYVFFFFIITGSYSSRRGCFVWLTQKDTTICVQTYSELCKLIKKTKNLLLMNAVCGMQALFLDQERQSNGNIFLKSKTIILKCLEINLTLFLCRKSSR